MLSLLLLFPSNVLVGSDAVVVVVVTSKETKNIILGSPKREREVNLTSLTRGALGFGKHFYIRDRPTHQFPYR